jgi:hypothetical protein
MFLFRVLVSSITCKKLSITIVNSLSLKYKLTSWVWVCVYVCLRVRVTEWVSCHSIGRQLKFHLWFLRPQNINNWTDTVLTVARLHASRLQQTRTTLRHKQRSSGEWRQLRTGRVAKLAAALYRSLRSKRDGVFSWPWSLQLGDGCCAVSCNDHFLLNSMWTCSVRTACRSQRDGTLQSQPHL